MCGSVRRLFYPLFIEEEEEVFFSLFIFRLLFFVSCLFVCVFVVRGGVICVACIIILYSRTDAIHFKRYY